MNVCVIGGGYVGTVTAAGLARRGTNVVLLEVDPERVRSFARGEVPFHEPGLQDLFAAMVRDGHLRVDGDPGRALEDADAILICVGTPLDAAGGADLTQVRSACSEVRRWAPDAVVVIRSTLPLGSTDLVTEWLGRADMDGVATNPEFLRQGTAIDDFLRPNRIVIGTSTGRRTAAAEVVERLYAGIDAPVIVGDFASAELIKNAANAYLAMKLSFVNEIADLCEAYGGDIDTVTKGIGLDPRIGSSYLRPGIGFGGSCLPKELDNLVRLGRSQDLAIHTFAAASQSNVERPGRIATRLERVLGPLAGQRIGLLGLAFKAGTDDTRYSPALALARELLARGATIRAHDPKVSAAATDGLDGLVRTAKMEDVFADADLVVLATEWPDYRAADWRALAERVRTPVVFDGRNLLDRSDLEAAGWRVISVGTRAGEAPR
ncbi:MAG TPA: UDP-glucose/GDP-mannose dehydrogenase family protein [Candidatus Limnocylindrales bacterium]